MANYRGGRRGPSYLPHGEGSPLTVVVETHCPQSATAGGLQPSGKSWFQNLLLSSQAKQSQKLPRDGLEVPQLLDLLTFWKSTGTGLLLFAGRWGMALLPPEPACVQPGPHHTNILSYLTPWHPNSTACGQPSPHLPAPVLWTLPAASTPCHRPWGDALPVPGSCPRKPCLAPVCQSYLPTGHKASITAWLLPGCLRLVLAPVSCPVCCHHVPGSLPAWHTHPQLPRSGPICLPLAAVPQDTPPSTFLPAGLSLFGLQATHGDRRHLSIAWAQTSAWSSGSLLCFGLMPLACPGICQTAPESLRPLSTLYWFPASSVSFLLSQTSSLFSFYIFILKLWQTYKKVKSKMKKKKKTTQNAITKLRLPLYMIIINSNNFFKFVN